MFKKLSCFESCMKKDKNKCQKRGKNVDCRTSIPDIILTVPVTLVFISVPLKHHKLHNLERDKTAMKICTKFVTNENHDSA